MSQIRLWFQLFIVQLQQDLHWLYPLEESPDGVTEWITDHFLPGNLPRIQLPRGPLSMVALPLKLLYLLRSAPTLDDLTVIALLKAPKQAALQQPCHAHKGEWRESDPLFDVMLHPQHQRDLGVAAIALTAAATASVTLSNQITTAAAIGRLAHNIPCSRTKCSPISRCTNCRS
ncbi:hypothetical protein H920_18803 [Fukomys damarensis]|uniref:Uncharacterized protein n=1 Tax=Fukomys damarensis TaxID=885580 RepID=A0A091CLZ3_FUKDA|nr:hypothetical protein H920_18803 [Fukomys damarensis]